MSERSSRDNTTDLFVLVGHYTGLCGCDVGFPVGGSSNVRKGALGESIDGCADVMRRWEPVTKSDDAMITTPL